MKIRKAVFPAAGLGTRFLPATKAQPKEMLPIVDKPTIQYAVEEAVASGIQDIIIITGRGKNAIEDHFDRSWELEHVLIKKGRNDLLEEILKISELTSFCYIRQKEPLGLGHAILLTKELLEKEPFAVFLGDDIIDSSIPCMKQMMEVYNKYQCPVIAIERVSKDEVSNYGIIKARPLGDNLYQVLDLVEKPPLTEAPSDLAIIGRYILTPGIFQALEQTPPDKGGEVQLTNGLKLLLENQTIYGYQFEGKRYDAGSKLGFLKATVEFALRRPDLVQGFKEYLISLDLDTFNLKES